MKRSANEEVVDIYDSDSENELPLKSARQCEVGLPSSPHQRTQRLVRDNFAAESASCTQRTHGRDFENRSWDNVTEYANVMAGLSRRSREPFVVAERFSRLHLPTEEAFLSRAISESNREVTGAQDYEFLQSEEADRQNIPSLRLRLVLICETSSGKNSGASPKRK